MRTLRQNQKWITFLPGRMWWRMIDWLAGSGGHVADRDYPRDMLFVALFAGLCHADTVNLTWDNVDLTARVLTVNTNSARLSLATQRLLI